MKKKLAMALLSFSMIYGGQMVSPLLVQAAEATFTATHYGNGFDYHDDGTMEIADGWSNGGFFNCTWRPDNVWFQDGMMCLKIDNDIDGEGYSGGEYRTKQTYGYGMYSVSMKPIKNPGVVSSFFTYTGPTDGTQWDEIDIEFLGYDTTKVQFNYFTNGEGNHEFLYDLGFDASQEFHTYGFYWAPDYIAWFVDGNEVYRATANIPWTPGKVMMNTWPGIGVDDWLQPYNGKTPLVAYYDWFAYDAPTGEIGTSSGSTDSSEAVQFNSNQLQKIVSKVSGKVVDVDHGYQDNGANILQYQYEGNANQKWYIKQLDNGYYIIESEATGKVLTVQDHSTENGANIHQWEYVGNANQEWSIIKTTNGYYKFKNRNSGKLLDVKDHSTANNANIQQWEETSDSEAYLWSIEGLEIKSSSSTSSSTSTSTNTGTPDVSVTSTHYGNGLNAHDGTTMEVANGWTNGGFFNCTWRPDNIWFQDGMMCLKIDNDIDGEGYSGGEYRSINKYGYGMYSVSMKPIKNPGVVSSFFTYTGPSDGTQWDEIDIEFLGYDTTKVQFNYFTNGEGNHEFLYDLGFDASQEFHTYGFYWAPDYIAWYVDGNEVYRATANIPWTPSKIMMNTWPGIGVDDWLQPYNGKTPLIAYYDWFAFDAQS